LLDAKNQTRKQFDPTQQQTEAMLSRAFDQTGAVLLPMHSRRS
jgi:hypothetical protein